MTNTIYRNIIITLLLVLMQVFVFNNIHFLGKGTPMIYIYAILSFPKSTPRILQLFIAFFLGLTIDLFSNTPGMHASATLFLALAFPYLFKMFTPFNDIDIEEASSPSFGFFSYTYYLIFGTLLHHTILMFIESASLLLWESTLMRIGLSSILTIVFMLIIDLLNHARK